MRIQACKTSIVWFRFFRQKTYPWTILAIAAYKLVHLRGIEQDREKARLMTTVVKIDFVSVYAFMNDLLW